MVHYKLQAYLLWQNPRHMKFLRGVTKLLFFVGLSLCLSDKADAQHRAPYCDLFKSITNDGKTIITKTTLYIPQIENSIVDGGDSFFFSQECNNRDNFALPDFSAIVDRGIFGTFPNKPSDKNGWKLFYVTFEGKFSIALQPTYGHLSFLRAKFEVIRIIALKPVDKRYPPPDIKRDAPIIETVEALRFINSELLFSIFGNRIDSFGFKNILAGQMKVVFNGNPVKLDNLGGMLQRGNEAQLGVGVDKVVEHGNEWELQGTVMETNSDGSSNIFYFSSKYFVRHGNPKTLNYLEIKEIN